MRHKIIARLIKYTLKIILATCKISVKGLDYIPAQKGPIIIALWHNRLAPLAEILSPLLKKHSFTAFVSKSRDGEFLSQFCLSYPNGNVIRVPHNGRDKALKAMIDTLKNDDSIIIITPDGPRGPVYQMKPGVLFAAKETGASLIPFSWTANRFYELKSWDKFRIPLPFSHIQAEFGNALDSKELTIDELQDHLNSLLKHSL